MKNLRERWHGLTVLGVVAFAAACMTVAPAPSFADIAGGGGGGGPITEWCSDGRPISYWGYDDAKAQSYSSNTNWLILVDTSRCITSIYTGSWNNWSLNRRYVCSTGKASTPTVIGEYQVYGKGYSFGHGYTCYYYTQFYGDYLFHSSPYYVNSNRVMDPTMGVPSSAGCVRLEIQNAKWIYDNIPYGTKVVTY